MSKSVAPKCTRDPRIEQLAEALKALADPTRLRVMCFLSKGERCVCEVESELGISQQLTSHHVSVLRDAGLLDYRKEGTSSYYWVVQDRLRAVNETYWEYLDHRKVKIRHGRPAVC